MMFLEHITERLDNYLKNVQGRDRYIIFISPILVLGYLSYMFLYPMAEKHMVQAINERNRIKSETEQYSQMLQASTYSKEDYFNQLKLRNDKIKDEVAQYKALTGLIENELNKRSSLKISDAERSRFLDSLVAISKKNHLQLLSINYSDTNRSSDAYFANKGLYSLHVEGSFQNTMQFLRDVEYERPFSYLTQGILTAKQGNKPLQSQLEIEIWGVK